MPASASNAPALPHLGEIGLEGFAPYLMNRIMGRYNAALRDQMAGLGLTTTKARALAVLAVIEAPLIRELAVHAVTDPSTLSRALEGLDAEGLINRDPDAADSRATRVRLTPPGREAFNRLWPQMAAAQAALFRGIPETERRAFIGTLQRILRNIRKHEI
jgi:DNA-binding MarR family transcriptional regulator